MLRTDESADEALSDGLTAASHNYKKKKKKVLSLARSVNFVKTNLQIRRVRVASVLHTHTHTLLGIHC